MALAFTSVENIFRVEPKLSTDITDLSSADIVFMAENAEAEVNAAIIRNYDLPITDTIPLLIAIATDLAIYRILSRRVFTQERMKTSTWPSVFKEARDMLKKIANGDMILVNSAGEVLTSNTTIAQVTSNTVGYHPTFYEGNTFNMPQDDDKIEDEEDLRGL